MKILYAIQGTGNGHLSRARDIYPELKKYGDVDILVSGYQADVALPFPITYKLKGLSFMFGKQGGVSLWETFKKMDLITLLSDTYRLSVEDYDLVINDFEPVSAWACKFRDVPCIALSHQSAVIQPMAAKPKKKGLFGQFVLNCYAPYSDYFGFHFKSYGDKIFTPVIRKEVQDLIPTEEPHYTVYLPAYDDTALIKFLYRFKNIKWEVFSKHNKEAFQFENIHIQKVENESFLKSLATCSGALLGAGFEGPAEALYLNKKLMVIPMKRQHEQQCNAAALAELGVPVIDALSAKNLKVFTQWLASEDKVQISFAEDTAAIAVGKLIDDFIVKAEYAQHMSELKKGNGIYEI